jgi:hypothetical protein
MKPLVAVGAVMLVLSLLVASWAECAWVLWLERMSLGGEVRHWHVINAASTVSGCDASPSGHRIKVQGKRAPGATI